MSLPSMWSLSRYSCPDKITCFRSKENPLLISKGCIYGHCLSFDMNRTIKKTKTFHMCVLLVYWDVSFVIIPLTIAQACHWKLKSKLPELNVLRQRDKKSADFPFLRIGWLDFGQDESKICTKLFFLETNIYVFFFFWFNYQSRATAHFPEHHKKQTLPCCTQGLVWRTIGAILKNAAYG